MNFTTEFTVKNVTKSKAEIKLKTSTDFMAKTRV